LKREPSTAARSLRAASLAITVVSLVAFSTIAYSFYADYEALSGGQRPGGPPPNQSVRTVVNNTSATTYVNITVTNNGLYPLTVGLSCLSSNGSVVVKCSNSSITVPPGSKQILHFVMNLQNLSQAPPGNFTVMGDISLSLPPFVSVNIIRPIASSSEQGG